MPDGDLRKHSSLADCGVCGGADFSPFFRAREWSCSGRYLTEPVTPAGEPVTIVLEACVNCGLVRQAAGQEVHLDYVEIGRGTAKQLPDYAAGIISRFAMCGVRPEDLVLEVGANEGSFLRALLAAGHRNVLGVEPSRTLAQQAVDSGLDVVQDFFGMDLVHRLRAHRGLAAAVICRHTLEHVPDIRGMVSAISAMLRPGGLCFIEVPDCDWIIPGLLAHEIWDEHLTYFRAGSLARLVRSGGLTPVRLERQRFRDTRNLLCWSVKGSVPPGVSGRIAEDATLPMELEQYQFRWDAFAVRLRNGLEASPKPVVGIGASHIQINFFNFAGLDDAVDMLIDDDPSKAGRFAPLARAVPIITTEEALRTLRGGTIIRSAFPYPSWQDRICRELAPYGLAIFDPEAFR